MPLILLPLLAVLLVIVLIPLSLVQRFRAGTARRPARRWVATLNLVAVALSVVLFLVGALVTSVWFPQVLAYTLGGLTLGAILGGAGIAVTRWEFVGGRAYYTPNRLLVLAITLIVSARVLYGFWRSWEVWKDGVGPLTSAASGLPASMSAGAVVLGYYFVFWAGTRWRIARAK